MVISDLCILQTVMAHGVVVVGVMVCDVHVHHMLPCQWYVVCILRLELYQGHIPCAVYGAHMHRTQPQCCILMLYNILAQQDWV